MRREGAGVPLARNLTFFAADLAEESPWPLFGPAATDRGIRSMLALPLFADGTMGGLSLYARYPQAFNVIDRARGLLLAGLAAMAFTSARSHEADERREANLRAALGTSEVISQAQGILIERERITADQAFDILRRASHTSTSNSATSPKPSSTPAKNPTRAQLNVLSLDPRRSAHSHRSGVRRLKWRAGDSPQTFVTNLRERSPVVTRDNLANHALHGADIELSLDLAMTTAVFPRRLWHRDVMAAFAVSGDSPWPEGDRLVTIGVPPYPR